MLSDQLECLDHFVIGVVNAHADIDRAVFCHLAGSICEEDIVEGLISLSECGRPVALDAIKLGHREFGDYTSGSNISICLEGKPC
jgi:hypothetical protein